MNQNRKSTQSFPVVPGGPQNQNVNNIPVTNHASPNSIVSAESDGNIPEEGEIPGLQSHLNPVPINVN